MSFSVILTKSNKQSVLQLKVKPDVESQAVSAGEQAILQDYLASGNYRMGGKLKQVSDNIIGEPLKNSKGRPLEVQLLASAGVIDAMTTRMMINNTRAQELKKRLTKLQTPGDEGRSRV